MHLLTTAKITASAVLLTGVLTLSGCAMTDSMINRRSVDPATGVELFIDNITHERTASAVDAAGTPNEPSYDPVPSSGLTMLGSLFGLIPGGWGTVGLASLPALAALYWKFRRGKVAADAAKAGLKVLMAKFDEIKADWEADVLDADADGHVTLDEALTYIKTKGLSWLKPAALQSMLVIFADALMPAEQKRSALEAIAAKL